MKSKIKYLFIFASFILAFNFSKTSNIPIPKNWPKPVYDFSENPISKNKLLLGRVLFYDPILSEDNSISCVNCHSPFNAFTHVDHKLSHGIHDSIGTRNSPALMNLAWQPYFMWDGAISHLDRQALAPIANSDEMNETIEHVVLKLQKSKLYPSLFKRAFGDTAITTERMLKSISQFMLSLVSFQSKYDSVMNSKTQFSFQEKNGYQLFQKNCSSCHQEPLFSNYKMMNNGLQVDDVIHDIGRMKLTEISSDSLKFKVPTLRNIEFTFPYMHDGRFNKLSDVLKHYTSGIQKSATLAKELQKPIVLSANEKVDLIAFLLTLTDRKFLFNENFNYPKEVFFKKPNEKK